MELNSSAIRKVIMAKKLKEQIDMKNMENRLRALDNKTPIPYTEEEDMFIRLQKLGGKRKSKASRKTVSKRKRREKTRKSRKSSRKTNRRRK
jgi:hypothetical protein